MKKLLGLAWLLPLLFIAGCDTERPNVVIILADDLGWADVGYHGSEVRTPQLDALAQAGVTLDRFYVQPTCSPTRTALMTGRYPYRCGAHISVLRPWHKHGIPLEERFLSQMMHDAGYRTAMTGKWHLGVARRAYWPTARGFDLAHGHLGGAINYYTHHHENSSLLDWYDQDQIPLQEEGYSTDLIGARAVQDIAEHDFSKQPLFLYVPFNAPHIPLQAPEDEIAAYSHIENEERRIYSAMVTRMDRQIGHIVQALKEKGVLDNTLIIFASDNGGSSHGASNLPLRGGKGTPYEGGVRVPAFMHWPAGLKGGREFSRPLHIVDLYPTLIRLAGGTDDECLPLDGVDMWPAISSGEAAPERDLFLNVKDASGRGTILSGKWKLILSKPKRAPEGIPMEGANLRAELFDIEQDPLETTNLVLAHPEVVAELWDRLKERGKEVGDAAPYIARAPEGWEAPADWSNIPE